MDSFVAVCVFVLIVQHLPTGQCTTWPCDFETSDLCGYTQDTTDDLDWTRHAGDTPTSNTGPSVDHTLGTGYYMYLETSTGSPGEVARLVSAPFPASSSPYCLRFYYHMFGDSIDTLNVYIRKQGTLGTPVWTLSGNQGNTWTLGHAQLDGSSSFNVIFEAVRGDNFRGDIAIDDVSVSDDCVPIPTTVLPTTTPYPLASPSCTFELSSICGYRQGIHDSADWTWHQGHTDTDDTGPGFDHTLGTAQGHYMYFEASYINPGVKARLLSPTLSTIPSSSSLNNYCVTFWYHMYGPHIGTLNVNGKESGGSEVPIWSLSDGQGDVWRRGQLPLDGTTESTVVFEAVRGISYKGDIAIDDVDVIQYRGQCEFIPASAMVPLPSTSTTTTQSSSTLSVATTANQPSTATSTESQSTADTITTRPWSTTESIPSSTSVITPPTPTVTAQSLSTSTHLSTSGTQFTQTAATPTETSSTNFRITTGPSSTTGNIPSASSPSTASVTPSSMATSTSTYLSTLPTTGQSPTAMPTETSSTATTIATESWSTTRRPTSLQTGSPTNGVKTTAAQTSTATSTEASSTIATVATGSSWTPGRPSPTTSASDSPPPDMTTDRTTHTTMPTGPSFTQSSHTTGLGTTAGGNISAGQTNNNATTIIIAVAVVLSLVCGAVAGVVATVCYKKKKRTRSGHAKVKYVTEENTSASAGHSLPNGRVEFENPTFEHIYEELPNVVAHLTSRQDQRPLSAISSSQTEVYMEINDEKVFGAKASSQQPVKTSNGDYHISSSAKTKTLFPSPHQVDQRGRRHGGHRERNIADEHDRQGYRRDDYETENDFLPPISDSNMRGPNQRHIMNNFDEDYERIRHEHYQDLNPRPPAHYESLRPDRYQKLNVPEHAPNPDGYQSLRHDHYQHVGVPARAQNPDGYQSLRHNQYQNLSPHSQNDRPPYV